MNVLNTVRKQEKRKRGEQGKYTLGDSYKSFTFSDMLDVLG